MSGAASIFRIDQAGMVGLIYLSRIDQAGKGYMINPAHANPEFRQTTKICENLGIED